MSHTDSYGTFYFLLFPWAVHPYLSIIHSLDAWSQSCPSLLSLLIDSQPSFRCFTSPLGSNLIDSECFRLMIPN
jgi:hypothetical protein